MKKRSGDADVFLCFINSRVRKIKNEALSCPGIFSRTLCFYDVTSSPVWQESPAHARQKRKTWEDLDTAAATPFQRITCLREREGQTLSDLDLPSRDFDARQVKRRHGGEHSRSG